MKPFSTYQYIEGEPMTKRDKEEVGSKFWNDGKWNNFIVPLLPKDCSEMTLIDMGCNAGLFLKLAKDKGFHHAIGVDSDKEAIKKAEAYRYRVGGTYDIQRRLMEKSVTRLPLSDYTVLANSHYYFLINDWLEYLDRLVAKTCHCIIVTVNRKRNPYHAQADMESLKRYFKLWKEVNGVEELPFGDDGHPRRMWSLLYKSPFIRRVKISDLDRRNIPQDNYYRALDKTGNPFSTYYYRALKRYRKNKWTEKELREYVKEKQVLYENIKENGMMKPIIINRNKRVIDGNHRCSIMLHLGFKTIIARET